eukprot:6695349-Prymnesium_polylepis.1
MRARVTARYGRLCEAMIGTDQHGKHQPSRLTDSQSVSLPVPSPLSSTPTVSLSTDLVDVTDDAATFAAEGWSCETTLGHRALYMRALCRAGNSAGRP